MAERCTHVGDVALEVVPSGDGCVECLEIGSTWVHLRRCVECGHVGCCDSSLHRHARHHSHDTGHPLVQSFEPGEEWYFCFVDDFMFEVPDQPPSPAHP